LHFRIAVVEFFGTQFICLFVAHVVCCCPNLLPVKVCLRLAWVGFVVRRDKASEIWVEIPRKGFEISGSLGFRL
jgi:hypothetical protein